MIKRKSVLHNFFQLLTSQVVVSLAPLILIPIYINNLGSDDYGLYILCSSLCSFAQVIIQYGFNFTANRALSSCNKGDISLIISSTAWTQIFILIISIILFPLLALIYRDDVQFYLLSVFIILSFSFDVLIPQWKYHGLNLMAKFKNILIYQKIFTIVITLVIIPQTPNILLIPIISILATIITVITMRMIGEPTTLKYLYYEKPRIKLILKELKNGYPIFLSQILSQIYVYSPKLILGKFVPLGGIALYDVVEKILRLFKMPQYLLNQSLFPILSNRYSKNLKIKYFRLSLLVSIAAVLFFWIYKASLIEIFISNIEFPLQFANILILTIPIIYTTSYFGPLNLVVKGNDNAWKRSMIHGLLVFLTLSSLLVISNGINLNKFSIVILITEFSVLISSIIQSYQYEKKIINN